MADYFKQVLVAYKSYGFASLIPITKKVDDGIFIVPNKCFKR